MQTNGLIEISTEKSEQANTLIDIVQKSAPYQKLLESIHKESAISIGELPALLLIPRA